MDTFPPPARAVHLLAVPGFADWEPAHAVAELRRHGRYRIEVVGLTGDPVQSMGGVTVQPTRSLAAVNPADVAVFTLPGGDRWEQQPVEPELATLLAARALRGRLPPAGRFRLPGRAKSRLRRVRSPRDAVKSVAGAEAIVECRRVVAVLVDARWLRAEPYERRASRLRPRFVNLADYNNGFPGVQDDRANLNGYDCRVMLDANRLAFTRSGLELLPPLPSIRRSWTPPGAGPTSTVPPARPPDTCPCPGGNDRSPSGLPPKRPLHHMIPPRWDAGCLSS